MRNAVRVTPWLNVSSRGQELASVTGSVQSKYCTSATMYEDFDAWALEMLKHRKMHSLFQRQETPLDDPKRSAEPGKVMCRG
ncbi:MAG: hypothetical protein Q9178_007196 [Gyalolechia marmorata]